MSDRRYDTRSRDQLLAGSHFAPYSGTASIKTIGLRELRTLDQFLAWSNETDLELTGSDVFLAFAAQDKSTRRLENLRTALDRLLPSEASALVAVRDAIRRKHPRSRSCDRRDRATLLESSHIAPYRGLDAIEEVDLEDLRVLERFMAFAAERGIDVPDVKDFLSFCSDVTTSRRLRSLKAALDILLPGNPGVIITLNAAIAEKGTPRSPVKSPKARPPGKRRVTLAGLPDQWQRRLSALRAGRMINGRRPPARSVVNSMEEVLREYVKVQQDAGAGIDLTVEGLRRFEDSKARHAQRISDPKYAGQGNRPATRHTATMRIRQFAEYLSCDDMIIAAFRTHENALRRECDTVVPLKFGRYEDLPTLAETWELAHDLLEKSFRTKRRQTRLRLVNEAAVIALWTFIPLRLQDGQLLWGRDIYHDGTRYRIDIETQKEGKELRGRLHEALTPFLDALVLTGIDSAYLDAMRSRANAEELPVFVRTNGRMLGAGYPSAVWRKHLGTGAHIARTRIHTELGRLGREGVDAALALCAQRDQRSRTFYQARAVAVAQRTRGQEMIDAILEESSAEHQGA
ncbi:hypothetical protein N5A93_08270 [Roseovarius sp. EGI FJ00037]|uniref:hypothetical protein n=1 Tax=Roseovarius salincola TaxID=2978479 RepID=UPI0022A85740|nr:hypothetical protein [Roseovarius sp. EGI FJ00037]MCZ0812223.1 hypothetical protein [Roseovarius sp. EGI FJ00037]